MTKQTVDPDCNKCVNQIGVCPPWVQELRESLRIDMAQMADNIASIDEICKTDCPFTFHMCCGNYKEGLR